MRGYQVHEDDEQYSISFDVPGVTADDVTVKLEENGRVLHLSGARKVQEGDTFSEMKFAKRFTLGDNLDTEKLTANLSNGVLEVAAPKKEPEEKDESAKVIPITNK
jgi:HSP20 family protein